ncbi:MAG: RDD family protein [Candidatus Cyclobacteriaceae bacterium M3_2C_046]
METATSSTVQSANYAGFFIRFIAFIIDNIILGVVYFIVITPIIGVLGLGVSASGANLDNMDEAGAMALMGTIMGASMGIYLISMVVGWIYFAAMESSSKQATLGKMVVGIKVTGMNGEQLSFGKATIRYIGKVISGMIMLIGYIIAAFTEKKQALHDFIASTVVIK